MSPFQFSKRIINFQSFFSPSNDFQWRFFLQKKKEHKNYLRCSMKRLNIACYFVFFLITKSMYFMGSEIDIEVSILFRPPKNFILKHFRKGSTLHMPTFLLYVWTLLWKQEARVRWEPQRQGRVSAGCDCGCLCWPACPCISCPATPSSPLLSPSFRKDFISFQWGYNWHETLC